MTSEGKEEHVLTDAPAVLRKLLDILDVGGLLPRLVADGYLPQRDKKNAA